MKCWEKAASNPRAWHPMTEEEVDYCLEVLPPIYFPGGFAVSEPLRDAGADDSGKGWREVSGPVYLAIVRKDGAYYCRELTQGAMVPEARDLRNGRAEVQL